MITTQRYLKNKQLIGLTKTERGYNSFWNIDNSIITSKSWVSLVLIMSLFKKKNGRKPFTLFPEYYCNDTLCHLRKFTDIDYYRIDKSLMIDIDHIKDLLNSEKRYDFVIAVHFFGKEYDFNNLRSICKNNNVWLIEDAVHVLLPYGKIGKYGDFCIFSPWKTYGLYDGAILNINNDELLDEIRKTIENLAPSDSRKVNIWRIKKIIQRVLPNIKRGRINQYNRNIVDKYNKTNDEKPRKISEYSFHIIANMTQNEMETLMERKRELSMSIEDYIFRKYGVNSFYNEVFNNLMPYATVIELEDYQTKKRIAEEINRIGCIAYEWPDLSSDLPKVSDAEEIKRKLLLITVHDAIRFGRIRRKLEIRKYYRGVPRKRIEIESIDEADYKRFTDENFTPILQSLVYGDAKENVQGWKRSLYGISVNNERYAVFTVLKKYGFVNRINQGPVFNDNIGDEDRIAAISTIRKRLSGIKGVLFFAPSIERTGYSINNMLANGFEYRYSYFSTGIIDLGKSEDELRKQMSSKWRNCLKNAEKRALFVEDVKTDDEFRILLGLHATDKENSNYSDSGDDITNYLYKHGAILGINVKNQDNEIISFILFALHGNTATYYIGWSNEEGYKSNASRLLLWNGMLRLKELGYRWLDLGGIDFINTKGVAEFKAGTGCEMYKYVGEFVAL